MPFEQARPEQQSQIVQILTKNKLGTSHVKDSYDNFYVYKENKEDCENSGLIKAMGCYVPTKQEKAREVRSVVASNGILAKKVNLFLCEQIKKEGCKKAYGIIPKNLEGYIKLLKNHVGYESMDLEDIKDIIPRFENVEPSEYKDYVFLVNHLNSNPFLSPLIKDKSS